MMEYEVRFAAKHSDTGNRTPGYRVRGDNVSHYTISDVCGILIVIYNQFRTDGFAVPRPHGDFPYPACLLPSVRYLPVEMCL